MPSPTGITLRAVFFAVLFGACAQGGPGGSGCGGAPYNYPRAEAGKEPVENAASVRINQAALDFVADHLPDLIEGLCCDATAATTRQEAALMCWSKAPCFVEKVSTTDKRVNFYLGTPGAPLLLTGNTNEFNIELRNGDPFMNPGSADGAYVINGLGTGELSNRPYCNDTGGAVCQQQVANLARFCQASSGAGSQVCNNPNPSDPSKRDYCCGDDAHGVIWNTEPLDICDGDRAMPRCTGYPSSIGLFPAQLTKEHLTLVPVEGSGTMPAGIAVKLSGLDLGLDLRLALQNTGVTDFACALSDDNPATGTIRNASMAFTMRPQFSRLTPESPATLSVCEECLTIDDFSLTIDDPKIDADRGDRLCQDENWPLNAAAECSAACTLVDGSVGLFSWIFNGVQGLVDLLKEPIARQIAKLVADQLQGIQVGTSMQLDVRRMLRDQLPLRYGEPLGVMAEAHGRGLEVKNVGAVKGLIAGVDFGIESNGSVCVRPIAPPTQTTVADPELGPTVTIKDTSTIPPTNRYEIYHVGLALSRVALERSMYTVFHSGLLCLGIGTDEILELTNGSQLITAGVLFLLAPELEKVADAKAPIRFQVEPQSPPRVTFGSGLPTGIGPDGKPTIDSLLQVDIDALRLNFFLFSQKQMVRLFSVQADLHLGLSIQRQPDNRLSLSIDSLKTANIKTVFSDLVTRDFSPVIETLFGLATSALLTNEVSFKLDFDSVVANALNAPIYVRLNDIQRAGNNADFLAAYATMCDARAPKDTVCLTPPPPTPARVALSADALYREPQAGLPTSWRIEAEPTGWARVRVSDGPSSDEYTVVINGGTPSTLSQPDAEGYVWVKSPWLQLPGRHRALVRKQPHHQYSALADVGEVTIEVDADRPLVSLQATARGVRVLASDNVSQAEEVRVQGQLRQGDGSAEPVVLAVGQELALQPGQVLTVVGTDHAGRSSEVASFSARRAAQAGEGRSGCGCRQSDDADPVVLALVFVALARYSRRRSN